MDRDQQRSILENIRAYQQAEDRRHQSTLESMRAHQQAEERRRQATLESMRAHLQAEERRRQATLESIRVHQQEEERRRQATLESIRIHQQEEERRRQATLESIRLQQQEEERRRQATLESIRVHQQAEEQRRQAAEVRSTAEQHWNRGEDQRRRNAATQGGRNSDLDRLVYREYLSIWMDLGLHATQRAREQAMHFSNILARREQDGLDNEEYRDNCLFTLRRIIEEDSRPRTTVSVSDGVVHISITEDSGNANEPAARPTEQPSPTEAPQPESEEGAEVAAEVSSAMGEDDDGICIVCCDREVQTIVLPCMHRVMCFGCSERMKTTNNARRCIMCRGRIDQILVQK